MTKEKALEHLKSAALTFAATLLVELSIVMNGAESFAALTPAIFTAVVFTATRSALKAMIGIGK